MPAFWSGSFVKNCEIATSRSWSCIRGIGRRRSALIAENIVVDAPIPRATARIEIIVNPGVFTSIRQAYLRSRNIEPPRLRLHVQEITDCYSLGSHPVFDHAAVEQVDG